MTTAEATAASALLILAVTTLAWKTGSG